MAWSVSAVINPLKKLLFIVFVNVFLLKLLNNTLYFIFNTRKSLHTMYVHIYCIYVCMYILIKIGMVILSLCELLLVMVLR